MPARLRSRHERKGSPNSRVVPHCGWRDVIVLIEYKMGRMAHDPEERHKRAVGELWAQRSHGRARFGYVVDRNWHELQRALAE
jgi:hypothetical protein